jgi:hypothetical protein
MAAGAVHMVISDNAVFIGQCRGVHPLRSENAVYYLRLPRVLLRGIAQSSLCCGGKRVNFAMDADVMSVIDAIGEFFERRGDARAVAEAAAVGPTAQLSRWAALCELGLPALRMPEPDGVAAALLEATAAAEKIGAVLLPEPAISSIVLADACGALPEAASFVKDICTGTRVAALCGFDTVELSVEGTVHGFAYIPDDGLTEWVGLLAEAALVMVDCAALPEPISRFSVDSTRPWAEVDLRGAQPVDVFRLSTEAAQRIRRQLAVLTVAELVGGMQKVLDDTVGYVSDRQQFGRPIGSFQAVKHRLADMYVAIEQARAAVQLAAIECDQDAGAAALASAVRWVPRTAIDVFDSAIHLHGAMGYSWEVEIHLHMRRALATRHLLSRCELVTPTRNRQAV